MQHNKTNNKKCRNEGRNISLNKTRNLLFGNFHIHHYNVLGVIVSKIIEEQEEKRFITVTETGVKGITNENFTTTFKEFSVDFGKIISVDLHKNAIIINTYDDSYVCSGYDNVSKIKDIIMEKF